jgi:YbbR domain-containing protein
VGLVETAVADINLTGVRSDVDRQVELTARDAGGAIQPRVQMDPSSAEVLMNIEQVQTPQIVPVQVQIQGEVARGYNIVNIEREPQTVLVTGSLETLQSLDSLQTAPVDVSGASTTLTRSVALQLPNGVRTERPNVTVTVEIEPAPGARAITVAPIVTNVPDGLNVVLQTTALTVRVRGTTPVLNELTPGDIEATVDATGLGEGLHSLEVEVALPDGVTLTAVEPPQAVIALTP